MNQLYKTMILTVILVFAVGMLASCNNEKEKSCANGEDPTCFLIYLLSNPVPMNLSMSSTDLGGSGQGDTVNIAVYSSTDSTCSGTVEKTISFSDSSTFATSVSTIIPDSGLVQGTYYLKATRGAISSNCTDVKVNGISSKYYCRLSSTTFSC